LQNTEHVMWVTTVLPTTDTFTVKGDSYYPVIRTSKPDITQLFSVFLSSSKNIAGYYLIMLRRFPFTSSAVRYSNFVKIFQKCRSHLKILGVAKLTQCNVHTDEPQTLGKHSMKLFATGFWHPEFGHPCFID